MIYYLPGKAVPVQGLHERIGIELFHIEDPGAFQMPVSTIIAPIIVGTPVV